MEWRLDMETIAIVIMILGYFVCKSACSSAIKKHKRNKDDDMVEFINDLCELKYIDDQKRKELIVKYRKNRLQKIAKAYFSLGHLDPDEIGFTYDDFLKREAIYTTNTYREAVIADDEDITK